MDAVKLLLERASAVKLQEPGPSDDELETILRSALRAPDHGRLRPWRFIVISGAERERFGALLADSLKARDAGATPETLERERQKALRAPVIVVVAARTKASEQIPEVEQIVSAGAAAAHIMLAAQALGYGAMWRTGAPAYDARVKEGLGLQASDAIIGIIYVGTPAMAPRGSARPELGDFVTRWQG
ncbi:MAG TPA: nitroreductase family protein [Burkholderiales bacterium]|jgi:nitroreductase|nr:nitroreductase family protein [Burkholderiales bacterium]